MISLLELLSRDSSLGLIEVTEVFWFWSVGAGLCSVQVLKSVEDYQQSDQSDQ